MLYFFYHRFWHLLSFSVNISIITQVGSTFKEKQVWFFDFYKKLFKVSQRQTFQIKSKRLVFNSQIQKSMQLFLARALSQQHKHFKKGGISIHLVKSKSHPEQRQYLNAKLFKSAELLVEERNEERRLLMRGDGFWCVFLGCWSVDNNQFGMLVQSLPKVLADKLLLIELIDKLLSDILAETKHLEKGSSPFHCKELPAISIGDYLKRIAKFANCSHSIFLLSLIYIDRLQESIENFVVNYYCVHRLLISTIMVAAKYADDFFYKNEYYAKVGGISKSEINALQVQILTHLNYHLHVSDVELAVYIQKLEAYQDVNRDIHKTM